MDKCVWALAAVLLGACSQGTETGSTKDVMQDLLIESLQRRVDGLVESRNNDQHLKTARLKPSSKNYSNLVTDAGTFAVSLEGVEPYADGSRVRIRFGNMTSATIHELRVSLRWGPADDKAEFEGQPRSDPWRSLGGPFPAGKWHTEVVDLAGVPPSKLGKIEISNGFVENVSLLKE